jgi:hypothetical protein
MPVHGPPALRITCDTTVVIDALSGARPAAKHLFDAARSGSLDIAFATRLRNELRTFTFDQLADAIGDAPTLLPSPWRLGFGMLGIDTILGGAPGEVSTPTLDGIGKLQALDSDHLEAHRRAGRDVFVTSDRVLLKAARECGIDAVTPEDLLERLARRTP